MNNDFSSDEKKELINLVIRIKHRRWLFGYIRNPIFWIIFLLFLVAIDNWLNISYYGKHIIMNLAGINK